MTRGLGGVTLLPDSAGAFILWMLAGFVVAYILVPPAKSKAGKL